MTYLWNKDHVFQSNFFFSSVCLFFHFFVCKCNSLWNYLLGKSRTFPRGPWLIFCFILYICTGTLRLTSSLSDSKISLSFLVSYGLTGLGFCAVSFPPYTARLALLWQAFLLFPALDSLLCFAVWGSSALLCDRETALLCFRAGSRLVNCCWGKQRRPALPYVFQLGL